MWLPGLVLQKHGLVKDWAKGPSTGSAILELRVQRAQSHGREEGL